MMNEMKAMRRDGVPIVKIAEIFKIHRMTASHIVNGKYKSGV